MTLAKENTVAKAKSKPRIEEHPNHANHLCELVSRRQMSEVARLAKGAAYVCHICGRAAAKAENLCEPVQV